MNAKSQKDQSYSDGYKDTTKDSKDDVSRLKVEVEGVGVRGKGLDLVTPSCLNLDTTWREGGRERAEMVEPLGTRRKDRERRIDTLTNVTSKNHSS